jgi:Ca-activated chloride channel family protein
VNGVAEVALTQTYVNTGDKFLELQYRFPVHPNACIHKFVAVFSKVRMEGVVKEKETARVEYSEAVKAGKRAALGEVDAESSDVLALQLGNLGPGEEVSVEIHFAEELSLSLNTFYQFVLVPRLTPRYDNSIPPNDYLSAFRRSVKTVAGEFEWDFCLTLRAARRITSFQSPSHQLSVERKDDLGTEYSFTLAPGQGLTKPFSFLYTTEDFQLPSYTLGRTDAGSSVMVSFVPKFCALDLKDA